MLLALDVGNTQTSIGLFKDSELAATWRIASDMSATADQLMLTLHALTADPGRVLAVGKSESGDPPITDAVLCSVVPALTRAWSEVAARLVGERVKVISSTCHLNFAIDYPEPREIGADRLADAACAVDRFGAPVLVVDFGTATNFELVCLASGQATFIGGIIMPGLETSAAALFSHAAKLSTVELRAPAHLVGRSSVEAVQSGLIFGEVARVDGIVTQVLAEQERLGRPKPQVVATGGLAAQVAAYSQTIERVEPDLTLMGAALLYRYNA
ncbi:MAG: type III pantothenate kinase [Coriobacteriales bacterium]|nr:type III pantothenate kinase [Coriobacteriales bacterium]